MLLARVRKKNSLVEGYLYIFGPPEELISDQGANMISGLAKSFCNEYRICKVTTLAEHPRSDPAERAIKTLKTVLKKCVLEFGDDCDLHVGKALAAMRWRTSNATTISPFEVVCGRRPMLPSFLEFGTFNVDNPLLRAMNERKVGEIVKAALTGQAIRNKAAYDGRTALRRVSFVVGDHVMLKMICLSNVLDPQVSGPYVVVQWISETSVQLAAINGSWLSFHPVHANRL